MVAFPTFAAWAALHGKTYNSDDEVQIRENIYNMNVEFVQANNEDGTQGPSMFMDWTREEFAKEFLTLKPKQDSAPYLGRFKATGEDLPDTVDWVEQGAVSLVKDQGRCGSCWAFSAVGALEGRTQVARGGEIQQFSEQQLVDCDTENDGGCQGGLMDYAFQYVMDNGACTEESYGYKGKAGSCSSDSCTKGLAPGDVTGFQDVDADITALKEALSHGPVAVAVDAMTSFQFYFGGIVSSNLCGASLDHGVLAVGYGSEKGTNYWKVKNSWGSSWGENGYIRLNADKDGTGQCGILMGPPSYPIIASGSVTV
jgi:C1A family cysteine protease